jgi:hypothetical protein
MTHLSDDFLQAAKDYRYLLEMEYSPKSILKLVGDRYQLRSVERSMLNRGIVSTDKSLFRQKKLTSELAAESALYIDGYNVIRTVGSYLLGKTLFISTDGLLRDAAEMHRTTLKEKILVQTLTLLFDYLLFQKVRQIIIYLDQPISKSGELASELNDRINQHDLEGKALTVHSPDHHLKKVQNGIVCTADSVIVDECQVPVFDLARSILDINYQPDLIELNEL